MVFAIIPFGDMSNILVSGGRRPHSVGKEDLIGKFFGDPEIGAGRAQRAARTRNKAKTIFLFRSASPLGVPARVIDRRIRARLNAVACSNTRLATLPRPRTCSLRIAPV